MPDTLVDNLDFSALPNNVSNLLKDQIQLVCRNELLSDDLREMAAEVFKEMGWPEPVPSQVTLPLPGGEADSGVSLSYFRNQGDLGRFPFPALIFCILENSSMPEKLYRHCLLGAALCVLVRKNDYRDFDPSIKRLSSQLRLLVEEIDEQKLAAIPSLTLDPATDLKLIKSSIDTEKDEDAVARLMSVRALLNYFLKERKPKLRKKRDVRTVTIHSETDEDGRSCEILSQIPEYRVKGSGVSPVEFGGDQPQTELFTSVSELPGAKDLSSCPSLAVRKDKGMTNGILRRKYFSGADSRRRSADAVLACLKNCLEALEAQLNVSTLTNPSSTFWTSWELKLDIVLTIIAGRPFGWGRTVKHLSDKRKTLTEGVTWKFKQVYLIYQPEIQTKSVDLSAVVRKRIVEGDNSRQRKIDLDKLLLNRSTKPLWLALPSRLFEIVRKYFEDIAPWLDDGNRDRQLSLASILKEVSTSDFAPLTKGQLERFTRQCLMEQDIDPVLLAYICGDSPSDCAGLHYTQIDSGDIQGVYDAFLEKLNLDPAPESARNGNIVGSALVPTDTFIKERFNGIARQVLDWGDLKYSTSDFRYHNYYTLYAYLVLNMYVGHRGVGCPYELFSDFNSDYSLVLISDEDVGNKFQPRLGAIGSIGQKQMKNYRAYLESWLTGATFFRATIGNHIRKVLSNKAPTFFLFRKDGQITLLDPVDLKHYREYINPLAENWQRHWLRTVLTRKGFSGVQIDGLMGHTAFNRNPGNVQSSSDFNYLPKIADHVDKLLEELKVKAI